MNKKVLAVVVLDESGSMEPIKGKTISCLNEYIQSLEPQGKSCHMTLVKFHQGDISTVCDNVPVKDVPKLGNHNYHPNGGTPLLDAVGSTIRIVEEHVKRARDNPDVLFIVMTDGAENCSREFDQKQILETIGGKEKAGWTFVYLGANQDSWTSASALGYSSVRNVTNFTATPRGMESMTRDLIGATSCYFTDRAAHYSALAASVGPGDHTRLLRKANFQSKAFYGSTARNKKGG